MKHTPLLLILPLFALAVYSASPAQVQPDFDNAGDAARALADAQKQGEAARRRAQTLEVDAAGAEAALERTEQESAALAARIQEAEAAITENEARITLIEQQRAVLRVRLAARQQPLVRLTASLQRLSRRPPALSLLRPGSLSEAVYLRAVLETMLPQVQRRTAGLRSELDRGRTLQKQAGEATVALRQSQKDFSTRRQQLVAVEARQRIESRQASGSADREAERALALAEQTRDLTALMGELDRAGQLRAQLAALGGPVMRPAQPQAAQVVQGGPVQQTATSALSRYMLPVAGRLLSGFGDVRGGGPRTRGIALAPRAGAQAVAPARGRVAFAGPYQGFGQIVIIEHAGGWTSLITGLFALDTRVGAELVAGSPLGVAGQGHPVLTLELRRDGEPVNPLDYTTG